MDTLDERTPYAQEEVVGVGERILFPEDTVEEQQVVGRPLEVVDRPLVYSREEVASADERILYVQEEEVVVAGGIYSVPGGHG